MRGSTQLLDILAEQLAAVPLRVSEGLAGA